MKVASILALFFACLVGCSEAFQVNPSNSPRLATYLKAVEKPAPVVRESNTVVDAAKPNELIKLLPAVSALLVASPALAAPDQPQTHNETDRDHSDP